MPNSPDDPSLSPWLPRQPLDADRLDRWQGRTVMDVKTGPGLLSLRKGNSVTISLASQNPRRRSDQFYVAVTAAEAGFGFYIGQRFNFYSGPISAASPLSSAALGVLDPEELVIINMAEADWATGHMLTDGDVQVVQFFPAMWHPGGAVSTTGMRVCLIWGFDIIQCSTETGLGDFGSF